MSKLTPKRGWKKKFLTAFAEVGVVTYAARAAKVTRQAAYLARKIDPKFAARWDEAIEDSTQVMEAEAIRRAVKGTLKPVFQKGEQVGSVREYSDTLLMFLLKSRRPPVYRDGQAQPDQSQTQVVPVELLTRLFALAGTRPPDPGGPGAGAGDAAVAPEAGGAVPGVAE